MNRRGFIGGIGGLLALTALPKSVAALEAQGATALNPFDIFETLNVDVLNNMTDIIRHPDGTIEVVCYDGVTPMPIGEVNFTSIENGKYTSTRYHLTMDEPIRTESGRQLLAMLEAHGYTLEQIRTK